MKATDTELRASCTELVTWTLTKWGPARSVSSMAVPSNCGRLSAESSSCNASTWSPLIPPLAIREARWYAVSDVAFVIHSRSGSTLGEVCLSSSSALSVSRFSAATFCSERVSVSMTTS